MDFTVPAFLLVISVFNAQGFPEHAVGIMPNEAQCVKVQNIIINDYKELVKAEKLLPEDERVPRLQLLRADCWNVDIPINAQEAKGRT